MCLNERTDCGKVKERGGGKERLGGGRGNEQQSEWWALSLPPYFPPLKPLSHSLPLPHLGLEPMTHPVNEFKGGIAITEEATAEPARGSVKVCFCARLN